jgi:hypothetical protein
MGLAAVLVGARAVTCSGPVHVTVAPVGSGWVEPSVVSTTSSLTASPATAVSGVPAAATIAYVGVEEEDDEDDFELEHAARRATAVNAAGGRRRASRMAEFVDPDPRIGQRRLLEGAVVSLINAFVKLTGAVVSLINAFVKLTGAVVSFINAFVKLTGAVVSLINAFVKLTGALDRHLGAPARRRASLRKEG